MRGPDATRRTASADSIGAEPIAARILILLHEADPYPDGHSAFIWGLRDAWLESGLDVRVAKGLEQLESADLVIPHIDLTITPSAYREALDALPNVANRGVYDISKRRVSASLLAPDDPYSGPAIVKTNLNCGGAPERLVERASLSRPRRKLQQLLRGSTRRRDVVRGSHYRVFPDARQVPKRAFTDPRLVVEKFVPEREGATYFVRWYIFFGDRYRSLRVGTPHPIVKMSNLTSTELGLPIPREVVDIRERWGLDFGKIDFVIHEGRPVVLDINRTPADQPPPERLELCRPYGPGVLPLLARVRGVAPDLLYVDVDAPVA